MAVSACSPSHDDAPTASQSDGAHSRVSWKPGTDDTSVALGREQFLRCWPSAGQYDCIAAISISTAKVAKGAPQTTYYFRFHSPKLPDTPKSIEKLSIADGYACEVTRRDNVTTLQEMLWKSGRRVEERKSDQIGDHASWSLGEIGILSARHEIDPEKSYVVCMLLDDIVTRDGLIGLDSAMISPKKLFLPASRFDHAAPTATPVENTMGSGSELKPERDVGSLP